ncbi:hypothetical protein RQ479_29770 [Mesorhizobium sp. ISC25]|uniref:hypothetical protein n=1 Tax=Mesorhizobium sp. ISC25 TaxID=3077335 RepID=UPI0035E269C7
MSDQLAQTTSAHVGSWPLRNDNLLPAHAGLGPEDRGADHLENGTGQKHMDQLPNVVEHMWPMWRTPTNGSENSMRGQG